jgi:hypothetical protein
MLLLPFVPFHCRVPACLPVSDFASNHGRALPGALTIVTIAVLQIAAVARLAPCPAALRRTCRVNVRHTRPHRAQKHPASAPGPAPGRRAAAVSPPLTPPLLSGHMTPRARPCRPAQRRPR